MDDGREGAEERNYKLVCSITLVEIEMVHIVLGSDTIMLKKITSAFSKKKIVDKFFLKSLVTIVLNNSSLTTIFSNNLSLFTTGLNNQSLSTIAPEKQSLFTFVPNT